MPHQAHEIELIGGPLDGVSWTVLIGRPAIEVPIDRRAVDEFELVDHRMHRYELQADGRYRYVGVVVRAK